MKDSAVAYHDAVEETEDYKLLRELVFRECGTDQVIDPQLMGRLTPDSDTMREVFGETNYKGQVRKVSPTLSGGAMATSYPDPDASAPAHPYPDRPPSSQSSSTFSEIMTREYFPDPNAPVPYPSYSHLDDLNAFPVDHSLTEKFPLGTSSNISQARKFDNTDVLSTIFGDGYPMRRLPNAISGDPAWPLYATKPLPAPHHMTVADAVTGSTIKLADTTDMLEPAIRPKPTRTSKAASNRRKREMRTAELLKREKFGNDPSKKWIKLNPTKGMNVRAAKISSYNPKNYYNPLPEAPKPWACFEYENDGELENDTYYTVKQIEKYLFDHPLHHATENHDPKEGGLILWVQKVPADSARRYSTPHSSRCRFQKCFATNNTINQGQYRVAFDEQSFKNANYDPMHNAGYVHLYCLEKHLDLPLICQMLDVRAEDRVLPNELDAKNRMMMSTEQEQAAARKFIKYCKKKGVPVGYPNHKLPNRPHEGTLTHKLALTKKVNERGAVLRQQSQRGLRSSIISEHLGNLEVETKTRNAVRRAAADKAWESIKASSSFPDQTKGSKRKRKDEDDDEGQASSPKKRGRPRKEDKQRGFVKDESESDSGSDVIFVGSLPKRSQRKKRARSAGPS